MRRDLAAAAAAIGLALALCVGGGRAAGVEDGSAHFTRTPAKGPPGTTIAIKGWGCTLGGQPMEYAHLKLYRWVEAGQKPYILRKERPIDGDGRFNGTFDVPTDAPYGRWVVKVSCYAGDMGYGSEPQDFTVIDPDAPPPTTTAAAATTRSPPPTTAAPTTTTTTMPRTPMTTAAPKPSTSTSQVALAPINNPSNDRTAATALAVAALLGAGLLAARRVITARRR